jgi:hypothetical protein
MITRTVVLSALEEAFAREALEPSLPPHSDATSVEADVRAHLCEPFFLEAMVTDPGYPFASVGSKVSGYCVAHSTGYWLVYQPSEKRFHCFWGASPENLQAPGVYGTPQYCWSA